MRRNYKAEKYTDVEMANVDAGKCWCGKTKNEFQKGMRVYCTPEHRSIWWSKILTWQEFRDKILRERGRVCQSCGLKDDDPEEIKKTYKDFMQKVRETQPNIIQTIRLKHLDDFERDYEERYKRIMEEQIDDWDIEKYFKLHQLPYPKERYAKTYPFEVDHKIAIVNGGEEFDEDNVQVLCVSCHKAKTKEDMALAKEADKVDALKEQL